MSFCQQGDISAYPGIQPVASWEVHCNPPCFQHLYLDSLLPCTRLAASVICLFRGLALRLSGATSSAEFTRQLQKAMMQKI
ncbi:hypothetical protein CHARACLAT_032312 [Characodon lateralis]|uniref:Uncharacterized protein n=1 Tax=Characodon lateralis TaxID=208331 RepID=A0ABU7D2H1_9TELE|nr:hypothetical protein [Characodon lateralis]